MVFTMLSQAKRTLVFMSVLVLLGYGQAMYAMDPPLDDNSQRRVAGVLRSLERDRQKGINEWRREVGQCINKNNVPELRKLFELAREHGIETKEQLNHPCWNKLTSLHSAICNKIHTPEQTEIIVLLLENGADPNIQLQKYIQYKEIDLARGSTAVHLAIIYRHLPDVFEALAKFDADFWQVNLYGKTPLKMANTIGEPHIIECIENILSLSKLSEAFGRVELGSSESD